MTDYYSQEIQKRARTSGKYNEIMANLTKCPLCDLKEKYILLEMEEIVLTVNLFPYIDGHLMIIPRRHMEKISELKAKEWTVVKKLLDIGVNIIKAEFGTEAVNILYREGQKSGASLGHLHFHLIPTPEGFVTTINGQGISWNYQKLDYTPLEIAERLRKHVKKN
ncbi:hypothetical protein A3F07_02540 [candidate division WWE3 bacterium RIFCSPHIGHO2_12_FULL_38_15]|nr:MAG: hypothetical protein A3F07_02540 [candidate division WWE3 bacterium RIFCSPHIGHO2_12_FULL_38_15]OGC54219.1 MAG: hypothetical protein A3B64_03745 [candidate division WWE3 bacterium RIFCSPLOWO2_01_FULL_37_24]HLB51421.1 HIT family protein [Patescibacteria group bacterium]